MIEHYKNEHSSDSDHHQPSNDTDIIPIPNNNNNNTVHGIDHDSDHHARDTSSETMSLVRKARVAVRAITDSPTVSSSLNMHAH